MEGMNWNLPVLALRGLTVFPHMSMSLDVEREVSLRALEKAMEGDQRIFLVTQREIGTEAPEERDLYEVGTVCAIRQILKMSGSTVRILVDGFYRAKLCRLWQTEPYLQANVEELGETEVRQSPRVEALLRRTAILFGAYAELVGGVSDAARAMVLESRDPGALADFIAHNCDFRYHEKQEVLEERDPSQRLKHVNELLARENEVLSLQKEMEGKVRQELERGQREQILRTQIRVMQNELGEEDELEDYRQRIEALPLPEESRKHLLREVDRIARQPYGSAEAAVARNYLDVCLEMPWGVETKERLNVEAARKILERDHFGLEKVKERILESLAVRQMNPNGKAQILCLVGPPGVGKTSIAMSVAKATNRKLARLSLGGVRDEADIRGHRKTYIGSMPGRIIEAISRSGSMNPLLVLDEVDKLASDQRGDPASALLEVLDSEQNSAFRDHYLEIPVDLSRVMFLMTANTTETIPRPLLDRMEVIELPSYTDEEKLHIAVDYLLPKQKKANGIAPAALRVDEGALRTVIARYTRESGVRSLERELGRLCRKAAMAFATTDVKRISITAENVEGYLGTPRYTRDEAAKTDLVGVVNGLAWTQVGGEILPVEVGVMDGSGKLELTGNLGEVMQESCKAAMSCLRQRAAELGIPTDFYKTKDIHIHFPEGAVPKDGPSAGIAITTALLSALTDRAVRHDVAMTGEVTLRGRVMPIGGLREKTMGALRAGIRTVILPKENEKDLDEIDPNVRAKLRFVPVETVDAVFAEALVYPEAAPAARLDTVLPGAVEGGKLPALRV